MSAVIVDDEAAYADRPAASRVGVPAPTEEPRPDRGVALQIAGLSKRYGDRTVLNDITLYVPPGQFTAVVGRSGCGKSTLLRLVAGLELYDRGAIEVHSFRPAKDEPAEVRIMFQDPRLLPWKRVIDNVALGLERDQAVNAARVLAQVGLGDRGPDWPAILSGGQRQRVALARALVHEPQLLLLDEPLGALDALTRIEMQQLIERLWRERGFTALLVTHDVDEAVDLADRVILIEAGAVALDLPIDLPRPRRRGSPEFAALVERVLRRVLTRDGPAGDMVSQGQ